MSRSGGHGADEPAKFFVPILISTAIGVVAGFRLMYLETTNKKATKQGVRAGGTSRVYMRDLSGERIAANRAARATGDDSARSGASPNSANS
jgi:hypothetical protein